MYGVISITPKIERGKDVYYSSPVIIKSEQKSFKLPEYSLHFNEVTAGTITASTAGNWSDVATWVGGVLPAALMTLPLESYAVVWDVATIPRIPATGTLGTITAATTGTITVDVSGAACHTSGDCSINFTTGQAGTEHLFQVTGADTHFATFNCTSITASAATTSKYGIYHNSNGGTLNINCALVGGGSGGGNSQSGYS